MSLRYQYLGCTYSRRIDMRSISAPRLLFEVILSFWSHLTYLDLHYGAPIAIE